MMLALLPDQPCQPMADKAWSKDYLFKIIPNERALDQRSFLFFSRMVFRETFILLEKHF
jgi:hypothetical protein